MSKTIEFVKDNIFECKNHIQYLGSKINEDKKYPSLVKSHKEQIENLKQILQCLDQINLELKALEIVKSSINLSENREYYKNHAYLNVINYSDEEWLILKKALGVKDE